MKFKEAYKSSGTPVREPALIGKIVTIFFIIVVVKDMKRNLDKHFYQFTSFFFISLSVLTILGTRK